MTRIKQHMQTSAILLVAVVVLGTAFLFSGAYNIGANDPHFPIVYGALETLRDRSIAVRSKSIKVPDLTDAAMIRQGAGNYHAMCTGCHLMPGMAESEMHKGMYPQPPNLSQERVDPAEAFWVIKNGIKASGMPSWGKSMSDQYLWGLVAFQQKLPALSAEEYRALVASSGGHSHGGGETDTGGHSDGSQVHSHDEATPHSHDEAEPHSHDDAGPDSHDEAKPHSHDEASEHSHDEAAEKDGHAHSHDHVEATPSMPATTAETSAPAEPVAVIERFQRALVGGNTTQASELLDPSVKIFESGHIERSREEYASHHLKEDAAFLKTAKVQLLSRTGDAIGDSAWVGSENRIRATGADGKAAAVISTETMVLRKRADGWRIVHIHWSSRPDTGK